MLKNKKVEIQDWQIIDYKTAWDKQTHLQQSIVAQKIFNRKNEQQKEETKNYLIFCEHNPVYTLGKSGSINNLLIKNKELKDKNIQFYENNRGGDITFHGLQQMVVYPILDLDNFFTDIHKYLRFLEEVIIKILADYNIKAGRIEKQTGVWLDFDNEKARKICAFGIRASRWVTMHGLAFNVNTDLSYFNHIVPCGIADKAVTSLQKELNQTVKMEEVKQKFKKYFETVFECELSKV